ncbi:hypothetical protein BHM03_00007324 [Ensete ventricosum]|nr:hypothetical protein BHM03_00007324 [Ensete ventricosum]
MLFCSVHDRACCSSLSSKSQAILACSSERQASFPPSCAPNPKPEREREREGERGDTIMASLGSPSLPISNSRPRPRRNRGAILDSGCTKAISMPQLLPSRRFGPIGYRPIRCLTDSPKDLGAVKRPTDLVVSTATAQLPEVRTG